MIGTIVKTEAADLRVSADSAEQHGRLNLAAELRALAREVAGWSCTCGCVRVLLTVDGLLCALCGAKQ